MDTKTENKNAGIKLAKNYFLAQSLDGSGSSVDLLRDNRETAMELGAAIMGLMNSIAAYFGVPVFELCMENLPPDATDVPCDEIRTQAAAMTYLDLNGATTLKELTNATHTFPVPVLRQAAHELQRRINSEKEFDSAVMAQVMRNYRTRRETEGPGKSGEQYLEQAEEQVGED